MARNPAYSKNPPKITDGPMTGGGSGTGGGGGLGEEEHPGAGSPSIPSTVIGPNVDLAPAPPAPAPTPPPPPPGTDESSAKKIAQASKDEDETLQHGFASNILAGAMFQAPPELARNILLGN